MELVWATEDLVIAGQPYPGFPILLWDTMASCVPAIYREGVNLYLSIKTLAAFSWCADGSSLLAVSSANWPIAHYYSCNNQCPPHKCGSAKLLT